MRTETQTIFRFSELTEEAQATALEEVQQRLGEWIESDELAEVMAETLGFELGHHQGGLGEPLIGIELGEWSIDRNGRDYLTIEGSLHRNTTPNLPWPADCSYARFGRRNREWNGNDRDLWLDDAYPEWMADTDREDVQAFFDAVDDVIAKALAAGCSEYDYRFSEECAREYLDANDPETFNEDGAWI